MLSTPHAASTDTIPAQARALAQETSGAARTALYKWVLMCASHCKHHYIQSAHVFTISPSKCRACVFAGLQPYVKKIDLRQHRYFLSSDGQSYGP